MGISHSFPAQVAVYAGRLASTYAAAVASAFDASYPAAPGAAAGGDARLAAAGFLVGRAVHHANRSNWCRSCWRAACACAPAPAPAPSTLRVVVVVHPTEFLRPTSTARVLAELGAAALLVYGCPAHDRQLDALLAAEDVALLFPEDGADGPAALGGARRPVVLVPDGPWACARALVAALDARAGRRLRRVALAPEAVAAHASRLLDALHPGAGAGRPSTLEAVALCRSAAGDAPGGAALLAGLAPLVALCRAPAPPPAVEAGAWVDALAAAAAAAPPPPRGLRRCDVCARRSEPPSRPRAPRRSPSSPLAIARDRSSETWTSPRRHRA